MKLINKIEVELNKVEGITLIGKAKTNITVYILDEDYRKIINKLLKDKLTSEEFEKVKIIVSGPILPAVD